MSFTGRAFAAGVPANAKYRGDDGRRGARPTDLEPTTMMVGVVDRHTRVGVCGDGGRRIGAVVNSDVAGPIPHCPHRGGWYAHLLGSLPTIDTCG